MFMMSAFMWAGSLPHPGAGHGADRRASSYIAPMPTCAEAYRGIGVRIEDDIAIGRKPVMKTSTAGVVKKADDIEALMAAARQQ